MSDSNYPWDPLVSRVCAQASQWKKEGLPPPPCSSARRSQTRWGHLLRRFDVKAWLALRFSSAGSWKLKKNKTKKLKSRLRSGKGDPGSLPPPCLPWPHRGTSIASEASQTLYRRLQFSRGESEGGKPTMGGPLGPKKSLARGHAALARPQQQKWLLGCGLRIRSATLGPLHSASLTSPPPPPRARPGRFSFLCFVLFKCKLQH